MEQSKIIDTLETYQYPTGYMCLDLSSPHDACQSITIKRNREKNFDSLHKSKYWKIKIGPSQREAEVAMDLFVCMLNPLVKKNVMLYCPLWWQPLLCSLSLLVFAITSSYNAQFSLTLNDLTLLEAIFIALLHRRQLTWGILLNP